jgi:hypothetical protein
VLLRTPATFADCVEWAFKKFTRVMEFLPTAQLAAHGVDDDYWHGSPARILPFDVTVPAHAQFIVAAAALKARVHGIPIGDGDARAIVGECKKPAYRLVNFSETETVKIVDHLALLAQFESRKGALVAAAAKISPVIFDKDNDVHMDFCEGYIRARGQQRGIPMDAYPRLELMKKIGAIAPTLATTTAMVGGGAFAALPLLFADATKGTRQRFNGALALDGLSYDLMFPPGAPAKTKWGISDKLFGPWDVIECRGNPLVEEVVARIKDEHGVEITEWGLVTSMLIVAQGHGKRIVEFIREVTGVIDDVYELDQEAEDEEGNVVDFPPLRVWAADE